MTSIELLAPAKVNLYLKVLGKRRDSYHNILTVFERISLADKIMIRKTKKGIVVHSDKFITHSIKDNIVYKASQLILDYASLEAGVDIEIEKNIPIAAGLGGGSSDAASTLIGINRLFDLRIEKKELMKLGRRLGADVPFFVLEAPFALARGIGEKLKIIKPNQRYWHLLVYPGFKISTKDIYKRFDRAKILTLRRGSGSSHELLPNGLTNDRADVRINSLLEMPMDFGTAESMLYNNLEKVVSSNIYKISFILRRLSLALGKRAVVSGSGPSVFCLYKSRKEALGGRRKLYRAIRAEERKDWRVFVVKTY